MRKSIVIPSIAASAVAVGVGFYAADNPPVTVPVPVPVDPATMHDGILTMEMDPAEVFKRALWRRPAPDDKILHAERREWTKDSAGGVDHWQWFLAVKPGGALKTRLREENPFSVHPAGKVTGPAISGAPAWFPVDFTDFEVRVGGPQGSLVFLFSSDGGTFYATSSGGGFTPGVTGTLTSSGTPPLIRAQGRLPLSPPPPVPRNP